VLVSERERRAEKNRTTKETTIEASLHIDGTGTVEVSTGLPFFDHMVSSSVAMPHST
jgi:imidazoleglycerol-phosphate dehydratase